MKREVGTEEMGQHFRTLSVLAEVLGLSSFNSSSRESNILFGGYYMNMVSIRINAGKTHMHLKTSPRENDEVLL